MTRHHKTIRHQIQTTTPVTRRQLKLKQQEELEKLKEEQNSDRNTNEAEKNDKNEFQSDLCTETIRKLPEQIQSVNKSESLPSFDDSIIQIEAENILTQDIQSEEIIVEREEIQEIMADMNISKSIKDKLDVKMSFEDEDPTELDHGGESSDDIGDGESQEAQLSPEANQETFENQDASNVVSAHICKLQKKTEQEKLRRRLPVSIKELIDYHSSNGKSIKEIVSRINMVCKPEEKVSYGYVQKYLYRKKLEATTAKKARYYRKKYGFVYRRMRRKPVLTENHRQSRIQWCQTHMEDKFDQDIFIGKTSLKPFLASLNQLKGQPPDPNQPRQQTTLHLWGAISRKGASPLQIFDGSLTTAMYLEILLENVVPFIAENFPNSHRFHQDNNPKHSAKLSQEFLESTGINWVKSPPRSHDLNPIELVWTDLIQNVSKRLPKTLGQVVIAVKDYWKTLTPEKCSEFIDKLCNIVPRVLEKNGEWVSLS